MKKAFTTAVWLVKIILGSAVFSLGFNLFLSPHGLNAGGISGLAMVVEHLLQIGTVGLITAVMNLVLFLIGGMKIGKRFLAGSLVGAAVVSISLDLFALLPVPQTEPLLASLYGGVICGLGLGLVFSTGASTGGSDIVVRLLKRKWQNVPIGTINICFDMAVAVLTGLAFWDVSSALYSGVAIFVTGKVIDAVVYSFDYSKVALIVSEKHQSISEAILRDMDRGVTFLQGEGAYSHQEKKVILTAIKKHQLAELKQLVTEIDPDAFVIVQEAHQVLGDGFSRYTKDSL
ncbi:MAG: YitT family protein [Oscillospiraceae bacterium]|nr:YitT family protein [Oscillospiraceae bacterium]